MQQLLLEEVTEALLGASTALVAVAARSLGDVADDVTLPQFRALVVLASRPHLMAELALELACSPSTATRLCDRLVRKNLVQRSYREASRREVEVVLTRDGRKLVDRVRGKRRREIAKIVAAVPAPMRASMVEALNAFANAAAADDSAPQPWSSGWQL